MTSTKKNLRIASDELAEPTGVRNWRSEILMVAVVVAFNLGPLCTNEPFGRWQYMINGFIIGMVLAHFLRRLFDNERVGTLAILLVCTFAGSMLGVGKEQYRSILAGDEALMLCLDKTHGIAYLSGASSVRCSQFMITSNSKYLFLYDRSDDRARVIDRNHYSHWIY